MENLKQEIYDYIASHNLSEEELLHIDSYVGVILEKMKNIHDAQENILKDSKELEKFKNLLLEKIDSGD